MTAEEQVYLLGVAAQLFSHKPPGHKDVISSWSGVRPIITTGKNRDPSKASREHQVWVEPGLVSCSGGKLTTFHYMALDVIEKSQPLFCHMLLLLLLKNSTYSTIFRRQVLMFCRQTRFWGNVCWDVMELAHSVSSRSPRNGNIQKIPGTNACLGAGAVVL